MLKRLVWVTALALAGATQAQAAETPLCEAAQADAATPPFVGKRFEYRYGGFAALEQFVSESEMTFTITAGGTAGRTERVKYQAKKVAPDTYLIAWQEADGGTVVHIDNFCQQTSHSLYTSAQQKFHVSQGTVVLVK
jgi:hypothetical protein